MISELKLNKRKDFLSNNKEVGQFSPINDSDPEKMMKSVKNLEIDKKIKLIQKITNNDKLSKNSKFKFLKGKTSLDDLDSKELSKFNDLINNTKKSKELVDLPEFQTLKKMDDMFYAGDDAITNFNKQTKKFNDNFDMMKKLNKETNIAKNYKPNKVELKDYIKPENLEIRKKNIKALAKDKNIKLEGNVDTILEFDNNLVKKANIELEIKTKKKY